MAMMKQAEAEQLIFIAWERWLEEHPEITKPSGNDAFRFFLQLDKREDPALNFRCRGDKWQTVHAWLRGKGLVSIR